MSENPEVVRARMAVARAHRAKNTSTAELWELERDYAAERIAARVREIIDAAPPLTPAQRDRIAALLLGDAHV